MITMAGKKVLISKWKPGSLQNVEDIVAIEEPLQIMINGNPVSITMRTPGDDPALAVGFLFTEGIIHQFAQVESVQNTDDNIVNVLLEKSEKGHFESMQRNFYTTSSCGVCGKTSVDTIYQKIPHSLGKQKFTTRPEILTKLQDKLWNVQEAFQTTGGIHAAVLFRSTGDYVYHSEDVGRHNALDKLIGHCIMSEKTPLENHILLLSGRASFELLQKAAMAGIGFVCSVGAPSSLAVELADTLGITLVGFLKKGSFNVYTHPERIH